jgi:hypothetical protein
MTTSSDAGTALEREFSRSIAELQAALQQAADASARIQSLLPRVGTISAVFAELDAVLRSGREQIGAHDNPGTSYSRPTLVVPGTSHVAATQPFATRPEPQSPPDADRPVVTADFQPASTAGLKSFRLEFESSPGPLDLRTVDDAVSEHPAVRDVALLDYDGRRATLKVWIESSATAAEIQTSLIERAATIFSPGNDVTIVAVEDAA